MKDLEYLGCQVYKKDEYDKWKVMVLYKEYLPEGETREIGSTGDKIDYNINFHKIFNNFDSTVTHFGDIIHTLEAGEEIISNEYYKKILKKYSIE